MQRVNEQQTKYYNVNHQLKSYAVNDLMLLLTKNLKQKRLSKKLSHKFVKSFRMKDKTDEQAYCLMLLNIYRIYNTFYVLLLKSYLHRADDLKTEVMMQVLKLINDTKQ